MAKILINSRAFLSISQAFISITRINLQFGPGVFPMAMATVIESLAVISLFMSDLLYLATQLFIPSHFLEPRFICFSR